MATNTKQGTVTKIYDLQTLGYQEVKGQFKSLTQELERLKKVKQELNSQPSRIDDPARLQQVEASIRKTNAAYDATKVKLEAINRERQQHINVLAAEANSLNVLGSTTEKTAANSLSAYKLLNQQYRDARDNAAAMAQQFGIDSEQAKAAAASAAAYKQQLTEINTLIKNGGRPVSAPAIVSTDNLAELKAEQARAAGQGGGDVVTDLERAQAEAANTATAYGAAQKQASAAVTEMAEDIERVITPFEEYTGTLQSNIKQNETYKNRLGQISAELKNLNATTDAADKRSASYKNKVAGLVEEQKMLKIASGELNQTINAQVKYTQAAEGSNDQLNAKLGLARNLMRQLSDEEKASPFGKQLATDITTLDANLKKADASMGNYQRNVGNYSSAFGKAFGALKQAANILPGIGMQGIFMVLFLGLEKVATFLTEIASRTSKAREEAELYKTAVSDFSKEAVKNTAGDLSKLELLRRVITDTTKSQEARTAALREYNGIADQANQIDKGQLGNLNLINDRIAAQIQLIERRGMARAAESIISQRAEKLLLAQESAGTKVRETFSGAGGASGPAGGVGSGAASFDAGTPAYKVGDEVLMWDPATKKMKKVIVTKDVLDQQNLAAQEAARSRQRSNKEKLIQDLIAKDPAVAAAQKELDAALAAFQDKVADTFEDPQTKAATTKVVKNALSEIDANLRRELAAEETRVTEIKKTRKLTYEEEVQYAEKIEGINTKYLNQKIAYLSRQKALTAEEKATLAGFVKDRADIQLATQNKITEINNRYFQEEQAALKQRLEDEVRVIHEGEQAVLDDINKTEAEKVAAKNQANAAILAASERFQHDVEALQKKYGEQSVRAIKDIDDQISALRRAIAAGNKELALATIKDLEKELNEELAGYKKKMSQLRKEIAESNLTSAQKEAALRQLAEAEERGVLAIEVKAMRDKLLPLYKLLLEQKLITQEQYLAFLEKLNNKEAKLATDSTAKAESILKRATSLSDLISKAFGKLLGTKENSPEGKMVGQIVAESYELAQQAMHSFYDAERQRIQQNLDQQLERLEVEKKRAIAQAQSQAEIDSLEQQYAARKKKIEQEAHQQLKKTKKSEAKIALATELANLWSTVWQLGPIAGAIAGVVLSGLAVGRYAMRINEINREQFAYGGQPGVGEVPTGGGVFGGRPHSEGGTPFSYRGRAYEAEVGELSIIRTKNAPAGKTYTISGTHTQIASKLNELGGGRRFASGGRLARFEYGGSLGERLQAPVFTPAQQMAIVSQGGTSREDLQAMLEEMKGIAAATNNRIDRIQVQLVTGAVTEAQKKEVQQNSIGRL